MLIIYLLLHTELLLLIQWKSQKSKRNVEKDYWKVITKHYVKNVLKLVYQ